MSRLISISGASGAGKTTIAKLLAESIPSSTLILFDEHEDKVVFPQSYPKAMPEDYDLSELSEFVRIEKSETAESVVFDYPFGRLNETMTPLIDIAVFLSVPLDVSLARRTSRELRKRNPSESEWLLSQLEVWEKGARDFGIHWEQTVSRSCDLVVNGFAPPESIVREIATRLGEF